MIEFLEIDALKIIKEAVPDLVLLAATEKDDAVAQLRLAQGIQFLDISLNPDTVHAQQVALRIITVLLLDFSRCAKIGVHAEIQFYPVGLALLALRSTHLFRYNRRASLVSKGVE